MVPDDIRGFLCAQVSQESLETLEQLSAALQNFFDVHEH